MEQVWAWVQFGYWYSLGVVAVWAWSKLGMGINWAWVPIEYVYSLAIGTIVYRQGLVQLGYV